MSQFRNGLLAALLASTTALASLAAHAETISGALAKAYHLNSEMNSARAGVRVTDENVPIAKSGYRPTIAGSGAVDYSVTRNRLISPALDHQPVHRLVRRPDPPDFVRRLSDPEQCRGPPRRRSTPPTRACAIPSRTPCSMPLARTWTSSATGRSRCCASEPRIPVRAGAGRALPLRGRRGHPYRRRPGRSQPLGAVASWQRRAPRQVTSAATYHQIIGEEPGKLDPAAPLAKLLPKASVRRIVIAAAEHPAIIANLHLVDAAGFSVKSAEGSLCRSSRPMPVYRRAGPIPIPMPSVTELDFRQRV